MFVVVHGSLEIDWDSLKLLGKFIVDLVAEHTMT